MADMVKFLNFTPILEVGFIANLQQKKLSFYKLNEGPIHDEISGNYSITLNGCFNFSSNPPTAANFCSNGTLYLYNKESSLRDPKNKQDLLNSIGSEVSNTGEHIFTMCVYVHSW